MDKLSEGINKLKNYFTLEDNKIKCDYCDNTYDIILNTAEVIEHLKEHKEYEKAVSSESSQEDLEKFYIIDDNIIKCLKCNEKLCNPWNTRSIVHWHLVVGHVFDKETEENFLEWLRVNYELHESNAKQRCNTCGISITNKPKYLMDHLSIVHHKTCLGNMPNIRRRENSLDKFFGNWVWDYFIKNQEEANCSYGDAQFPCFRKIMYNSIRAHMKKEHSENYNPSQEYTHIQENLVKCDFCKKDFDVPFLINQWLEKHLLTKHGLKEDKSNHDIINDCKSNYFKKLGFQKYQCNKCNEVLRETCYFKLKEHSDSCQQINTSTEISSMGKSSTLLSSDENVKDTPTSSGHSQPGSSKSLDVDDRDSGTKRVKYDDDKCSRDELPRTSSNILDDTEGIAASNIDQQSARDQFSNTRLPSSSSDPANSAVLTIGDEYDLGDPDFPEIDKQDSHLNIVTMDIDTKEK